MEDTEVFLGRVTRNIFEASSWETKRLEENPLKDAGLLGRGIRHKMFAQRRELEDAGIEID